MTEYTLRSQEPDYDAALDVAAVAIQSVGDVAEQGFSFAQRAVVLEEINYLTTSPQKKQEVLDQLAVITEDPTFLKASVTYAKKCKRQAALKLTA
jgi:hypothetical protein